MPLWGFAIGGGVVVLLALYWAVRLARAGGSHGSKASTITVEGTVVDGPHTSIIRRRQHGCMGGPIVDVVPPFQLRLDDGSLVTIVLGVPPRIENVTRLQALLAARPRQSAVISEPPAHTGAPDSTTPLLGRVRVAGVRPRNANELEGEPGTLTILGDSAS